MNHRPQSPQSGTVPDWAGTLMDVRRRAEARVAEMLSRPRESPPDPAQLDRLLHELGVHQVELELQNEQLRQAQAALEAARDRYIDLYEHAPVGYVTLGLNGRIAKANRLAAKLLGTPQSQLGARRMSDFIATEDRPRFQQHQARLMRGNGSESVELRLAGPGAPRWVTVQMTLAADEVSGVPQCRAALLDISERLQLQEGVTRLAAIVASCEDAIVGRDLEGRITSWNDGARRLFGLEADEMIGRTMDALVPSDRRGEEEELLARLRFGERPPPLETERLARGGVVMPVSISLSPIRDPHGHVVGSSLIARDISERRRADEALQQRLRQLDVLSRAGQALIMGDQSLVAVRRELLDRVCQAVGSEICLDYGRGEEPETLVLVSSRGLAPGQVPQLAAPGGVESLCLQVTERLRPLVLEDLRSRPPAQAQQLQALGLRCFAGFPLRAQGRVYGVAAFASTTRDAFSKGDLKVIGTLCDQVSAMLERARLLDELHDSERSLKRADRAKDDFIATLAHELRNPLAAIRNAASVMHQGDLSNREQLAWCRDIIERQVAQMTHLLEDLLDVSRVTRNKIELRRERVALRRAIEQAVEATQPLIDSNRHRLVLQLPDEELVVHADLTRLTQVFANLLNNAAKYTDAGGEITLSVRREGDQARISVRDSGIGIEPQQLDDVFEMFAQLPPALGRSGRGLGIGLALSRRLVEQHGGQMEAHSEGTGRGSEFVVTLPAEPRARHKAPAVRAPHDETHSPRRRMLVVDDNVDAAQTLSTVLDLYGHDVRTAYGGLEALEAVEDWQPEVVVLDIGMRDLDGYEVCRRIRARSAVPRPLVIACTGWGQDDDRERAREAGFDFHLVKPVDPSAVLRLLAEPPPARSTSP